MEGLITFLAIVALVAVAFGISMTSAFWGIITFIVGAVVILVLLAIFGAGAARFLAWFNSPSQQPKTQPKPQPKPVIREAVIVKEPKHPMAKKIGGGIAIFILVYVFNTFMLAMIGAIANWKLYEVPHWVGIILPALPMLAYYLTIGIKALITKKHAKRKAKRA